MSTAMKYHCLPPGWSISAFAVPAASACVSSAQCVSVGEQNLAVMSEVAEAVTSTDFDFARANSITA